MRISLALICLFVQYFATSLALAQTEEASTLRMDAPAAEDAPNNLSLLHVELPVGTSILYQRRLTDQLAIGPFGAYNRFNPGSQDDKQPSVILRDVRWDILRYGLEARFKFSGYNTNGIYLAGAFQRVDVTGEGKGTRILSGEDVMVKSEKVSKNGYYAKFGYMARIKMSKRPGSSVFLLDFNTFWGTGNQLEWTETSLGTLTLNEIGASLGFGLGIGATF